MTRSIHSRRPWITGKEENSRAPQTIRLSSRDFPILLDEDKLSNKSPVSAPACLQALIGRREVEKVKFVLGVAGTHLLLLFAL